MQAGSDLSGGLGRLGAIGKGLIDELAIHNDGDQIETKIDERNRHR